MHDRSFILFIRVIHMEQNMNASLNQFEKLITYISYIFIDTEHSLSINYISVLYLF